MSKRAEKLADRFRPSIFDRMKQSWKDRQRNRPREKRAMAGGMAAPIGGSIYAPTGGAQWKDQTIWQTWATNQNDTTTSAWNIWTSNGTVGWPHNVITANAAWTIWTQTPTVSVHVDTAWQNWMMYPPSTRRDWTPPVETEAQKKLREAAEAQRRIDNARWQEEQRVADRKKKEADDRAIELLLSVLTEEQKRDFKREKHFFVDAPSGRLYRIDYGTHGNVRVVDRQTKKVIERLCIQPNGVPAGDANLMQKLLIETAEDVFRAHANITSADGRVAYGITELLTHEKLAKVIPFRKAA
jgi:hypothetical protein